ncbi:hypothetical protein GCM10009809_17360 [Isoptericola hypogeus]|uniref:Uncharacterized protein n=1 Tax=Isoptericola hypogeus TaxID=300179 RepID=A0ABP4VEP9_9MICO
MIRRRVIPRRVCRASAGLVAVLAASLSAACTFDAKPTAVDQVATYPAGDGGNAALLTGALAVEGGCVYVVDSDFGKRWLPVFPSGAVGWNGEVLTYGSEQYEPGAVIELGGGASGEDDPDPEIPDDWHVPAGCDATHTWIVAP